MNTSASSDSQKSSLGAMTPALSSLERQGLFEDLLSRGVLLRIRVTGRSMVPLLRGGEILTIRRTSESSLSKGDLVFFKNRDGHPVIHRIVKKYTHNGVLTFQTRGDALIGFDGPVREEHILGKVCRVERGRRHINLETACRRYMNYLRAMISLCGSRLYFTVSTFKNLLA